MTEIGRLLLICGLGLSLLGGLFLLGGRLGLGRLPGDLLIRGERFTLSVPIVSCIVVSIVLSFLVNWLFAGRGT